jgi:hypothetical protein
MIPQKRANADASGVVHSSKRLRIASATPGDPAQTPSEYDFNGDGSGESDSESGDHPIAQLSGS